MTTYTIDALNRQSAELHREGTRFTYSWDAASRQQTMQDVTGITTVGYDARDLQASVAYPTGKRLTYAFDPNANRLSLLDPDSKYVTYSWDPQNRLSTIQNQYNEVTSFVHDPLDREQKRILGNGITISHMFDAAGREIVLENRKLSGAALSVYTASYDAVGNRLSVAELDGSRVTYGYDAGYQLTSEDRSGANAFSYTLTHDALGNRLTKTQGAQITTYQFNAANELTLTQNPIGQPATSSYDGNGNLTLENAGGQLTTYSWDTENRLTRIDNPDGTNEQYTYSADGLRQKKVAASTVLFVWDGQNVLIETDGSLVTQAVNLDLPGIWGGKYSLRRSGQSSFYVPDYQGNTRQLADNSQTVTDTLLTDAWGREIASLGATVNCYKAFGQWGYYRDNASRYNVRHRHLSPSLARFLSRDSQSDTIANSYAYVSNKPLMLVDPSSNIELRPVKKPEWRIGSNRDCCGQAGAYWDFIPESGPFVGQKGLAPCTGWYVQKVTIQVEWRRCPNNPTAPTPPPPRTYHYFEAWKILKGKPYHTDYDLYGYTDAFTFSQRWSGIIGHFRTYGLVAFFCEPGESPYDPAATSFNPIGQGNVAISPWRFRSSGRFPDPCGASGQLLCAEASRITAGFANGKEFLSAVPPWSEPRANHFLDVRFRCCCDPVDLDYSISTVFPEPGFSTRPC